MDRIFYNKIKKDKVSSCEENIKYTNFDCKTLKKILNDYFSLVSKYNIFDSGLINEFLYDLDVAIASSGMTEVQAHRMFLWFNGYNEREIAEVEDVSIYVIHKSIVAACNKILDKLQENSQS